MHDLLNKRYIVSVLPDPTNTAGGPVDFNTTGDKFILSLPHPIDIYRFGFITIGLMDPDAGGFQLDLDKRIAVGSDSGRVSPVASIFRADADTVAAATVVYVDVTLPVAAATGADGSIVNVDPAGPVRINPGEEAVLEVSNAVGAASTGYVWIEYVQLPLDDAGQAKVVKDT